MGTRVIFVSADGHTRTEVEAAAGQTLLDVAHAHDIDIEGACEGNMACSTCHLIVDPDHFHRLPTPSDDEEDMLDLAWGLTETSRLGCQVVVTDALDGRVVRLPAETRDMR